MGKFRESLFKQFNSNHFEQKWVCLSMEDVLNGISPKTHWRHKKMLSQRIVEGNFIHRDCIASSAALMSRCLFKNFYHITIAKLSSDHKGSTPMFIACG